MKYIVKNFKLMRMINSQHSLYTISSGILMAMILLSPLHTIKAQEENEESDPLTILSNIRNLLDKSITELNTGNYTGASELVDIAYIDNYEYIEDPLKELDKDLMEETEVMIREDFASAIEDKKSLDAITTLHNAIKSNLDIAEKLFKK
ncbi:MAG: hypothetical protein ACXW07_09320 [Nitrososphaeraceae archaeon]